MKNIKALLRNEEAQGMVEYILIIAVVALVAVVAVKLFGNKIKDIFLRKTEELENATNSQ
jgi:pilus assembly protein Flp/PilA